MCKSGIAGGAKTVSIAVPSSNESNFKRESQLEEAGESNTEEEIWKAFVVLDFDEPDFLKQCPFLHAFHFNRLVIDQYTDVGDDRTAALLRLSARAK
ncbi:hypothetical protein N7451_008363 [Penicillium sp. IBT 35674x]|nr:hypothetical protein N7451_008363 [Penicillium sp. IBT 35674x]